MLDNTDIFDLVACLLCFRGPSRDSGLDDSLLDFAFCCRRSHSLGMRDGRWWEQQQLSFVMQALLISFFEWNCLSPDVDDVAVTVADLSPRKQRIMRHLLGDEVYEREVAPKLSEMHSVACDRSRGMAAVGLYEKSTYSDREDNGAHLPTEAGQGVVDVYPQLTPQLFDSLLPELQLPATTKRFARDEPYCQWLLGCWDAALLPKCTRWIPLATIVIDTEQGLLLGYQTICFLYTLERMHGVTQLSLIWSGLMTRQNYMEYCHTSVFPEDVIAAMPNLISLHIEQLLDNRQLLHLQLEDVPIHGLSYWDDACGRPVDFSYPAHPPPTELLRQQKADERRAKRINHRLRRALLAMWTDAVLECSEIR